MIRVAERRAVALWRGINVGTAKSVPMETLRTALSSLGLRRIETVLRSGNAVFSADSITPDFLASLPGEIERAVLAATGVDAAVMVFDEDEFRGIANANPFSGRDGSRAIVTFVAEQVPTGLTIPDAATLAPEELALADRAVYQWLPDGVLKSKVGPTFWRQFPSAVTARNTNTVARLLRTLG